MLRPFSHQAVIRKAAPFDGPGQLEGQVRWKGLQCRLGNQQGIRLSQLLQMARRIKNWAVGHTVVEINQGSPCVDANPKPEGGGQQIPVLVEGLCSLSIH